RHGREERRVDAVDLLAGKAGTHSSVVHRHLRNAQGDRRSQRLPFLGGAGLEPLSARSATAGAVSGMKRRPSSAASRHLLPREKAVDWPAPSPLGEGGPKGRVRGAIA